MGLLDDYSGEGGTLGIGMSPRPKAEHQDILLNIAGNLKFNHGIFCRTEFCVDKENLKSSKAPDVVIYENEDDRYPVVIIEITTENMCKSIIKEVTKLMKSFSMIEEAFVYDYESNEWYCYGKDVDPDEPSYSPLLDVDFADFIELE